ncbi:MAG: VWA domain-containing protein [Calditrichia bacterium]
MQAVTQPTLFNVLLTLFYSLRQHNFSLGIAEFKLALQAFSYGFGCESESDMVFTLQVLWGKSREEQEELGRMLLGILAEKRELVTQDRETTDESEESNKQETNSEKLDTNNTKDTEDVASGYNPRNDEPALSPDTDSTSPKPTAIPLGFLPEMPEGGTAVRIPKIRPLQINANLDLVGSYPIRQRHMKRAWRYYRRMRQDGPATILDIPGTVQQVAENGLLLHPVMRSRRTNQAELLLLVDEGGSMVPFRRIIQRLLNSVRQGGLSRYAVYYFHDVPRKSLFTDAKRSTGLPLQDVLSGFHDSGIMIISDGGAARRSNSKARVRRTNEFLETLRRYSPHIAWINPTPEERWKNSSADSISSSIPMLSLTRVGLDEAVDIIRGKAL